MKFNHRKLFMIAMNINHPEIILYRNDLKADFKRLNYEWLNKYYFVTEEDDKILADPEKIILEGGCIIFAKLEDEIVGTCALIRESADEYEIAKMAVTEKAQGRKVGRYLLKSIIEEAIKRKANIISLETASQLKAAIALYEKSGFLKTTGERTHPVFGRKTFRMELKVV